MKWLKSTTDKAYTIQGKTIPPANSAPLAVAETWYESIAKTPVIASLIKTGGIIVLDKYNAPEAGAANVKLSQLSEENTKLHARVRELEAEKGDAKKTKELAKKAAQYDELKNEAEQALAAKDAEIERLKAQLAEKE